MKKIYYDFMIDIKLNILVILSRTLTFYCNFDIRMMIIFIFTIIDFFIQFFLYNFFLNIFKFFDNILTFNFHDLNLFIYIFSKF